MKKIKKAMCQAINMSDDAVSSKCPFRVRYIICFKYPPFETKQLCGVHLRRYIRLCGKENLDIIRVR